jgi:hypothetical protein
MNILSSWQKGLKNTGGVKLTLNRNLDRDFILGYPGSSIYSQESLKVSGKAGYEGTHAIPALQRLR